MGTVRVYFDRAGNTLTVWFDNPQKEAVCQEIEDDIVLMKDRLGRVIGVERLNYLPRKMLSKGAVCPIEVQMLA